MHVFSHYDNVASLESFSARRMLDARLKNFRVSEDFCVAQDANLLPNQIVPVSVKLKSDLFPDKKLISLGLMKHIEISMRSCFAQSGIHIVGNFFAAMSDEDIDRLQQDGEVDVTVSVVNRGLSPVQVSGGMPFFRLYLRPSGNAITGKELYDRIMRGELKIEGEYGKTWSLVGADMSEGLPLDSLCEAKELAESEIDQAMTLKLYLNDRVYIPNNHKGIQIHSKKNLVDILEPFDAKRLDHAEHNFHIGETHYVDFGEYFGVIIYQGYEGGGHHIISPLIDPGFMGPIRTEIVKGHEFNNFIELHIYHRDG